MDSVFLELPVQQATGHATGIRQRRVQESEVLCRAPFLGTPSFTSSHMVLAAAATWQ